MWESWTSLPKQNESAKNYHHTQPTKPHPNLTLQESQLIPSPAPCAGAPGHRSRHSPGSRWWGSPILWPRQPWCTRPGVLPVIAAPQTLNKTSTSEISESKGRRLQKSMNLKNGKSLCISPALVYIVHGDPIFFLSHQPNFFPQSLPGTSQHSWHGRSCGAWLEDKFVLYCLFGCH